MDVECHSPQMFEEAKAIIKDEVCMRFYDETKPLCIKADVSGVGLGAALLQTRDNRSCHRGEASGNHIF